MDKSVDMKVLWPVRANADEGFSIMGSQHLREQALFSLSFRYFSAYISMTCVFFQGIWPAARRSVTWAQRKGIHFQAPMRIVEKYGDTSI